MPENIIIHQQNLLDLDTVQCGAEACLPYHSFGPAVRDFYLVHFVRFGKGVFHTDGKEWPVQAGQGFLICPNHISLYTANGQTPWSYVWIGFKGTKAADWLRLAGLSRENPVFSDTSGFIASCFEQMLGTAAMNHGREMRLLGLLHLFLSELAETTPNKPSLMDGQIRKEAHIRKALDYMTMNYTRNIDVAGVAAYVGLERTYFSTLFRTMMGQTPKEFLIHYRIEKACAYMRSTSLSIGDIARSVGYEDPLLFSKMFRKVKQMSPRAFRQRPKTPG